MVSVPFQRHTFKKLFVIYLLASTGSSPLLGSSPAAVSRCTLQLQCVCPSHLAALSRCRAPAPGCKGFSSCSKWVPEVAVPCLQSMAQQPGQNGPSCSISFGLSHTRDQNSCPLHWQADSPLLSHQGSPRHIIL